MINLNLVDKPWRDPELSNYNSEINNIYEEEDLTGAELLNLMIKNLPEEYLKKTERNYKGINENPFDLIVGDEKSLEMIGIEIKGDTDNYSRLPDQLQAYSFVFKKLYLLIHKKKVPDWLPEYVGVLRLSNSGKVYEEQRSYVRDPLDISTNFEWDALFKANGLGSNSSKSRETLDLIRKVRNNVLFNRFFAVQEEYGLKNFKKFYPLSDKEKEVIIGFDVPHHFKTLAKEILAIEKKIELIKKVTSLSDEAGIGKFLKKEKK